MDLKNFLSRNLWTLAISAGARFFTKRWWNLSPFWSSIFFTKKGITPKLFELETWNFDTYLLFPLATDTPSFDNILAEIIFFDSMSSLQSFIIRYRSMWWCFWLHLFKSFSNFSSTNIQPQPSIKKFDGKIIQIITSYFEWVARA